MKSSGKNSMARVEFALALAAAFLVLLPTASQAGGLTVVNLHSFDLFLNGAVPYASLAQGSNGLFYGTTFQGGAGNAGTVFELASNGIVRVLYSFTNGVDGGFPEAGLALASDGNFYGTTFEGGSNATGVVFQISPAGSFSPLYSFGKIDASGENHDGANPVTSLIQAADGNLYGTATAGGANGSGALFKISLGGSFQLVHAFSALDINGDNSEGASPQAALIEGADGNLYGTAESGGAHGVGAIFEYLVAQNQVSALYSFLGAGDGSRPVAALAQGTDGNFYGTTSQGGTNAFGALFKITSDGAFTPLYAFKDVQDGANPVAPLVQGASGSFYGTSTGPQDGFGTIFEMATNGAVTPLYAFTGGNDGAYPEAALVRGADGILFGTTSSGGTNNKGTVFSITSLGAFSSVMSFIGGADGDEPEAPLIRAANGILYGTTYLGGTANDGVVFELTTNGALSALYTFTNGLDGANPAAGLALGGDGNLYGTTYDGGANHAGVLFQMTPQGALAVLHSLTNLVEGSHPMGGLTQGIDGNFYGTTYQGGSHSVGAIFQMTLQGSVTPLYAFTNGVDGAYPKAGLAQGGDSYLYGTTSLGGTNNHGTIFKMTTGGVLTALYSFTNGADGAAPECQLLQWTNGNFYGTTSKGGAKGYGGVFEITPGGSLTPLYSFTNGIDGATPEAGLSLGPNGNLYGLTSAGGSYGAGTLFEIVPGAGLTPLYSFNGVNAGASPVAALTLGFDGSFYGTASGGGVADGGTAFRVILSGKSAPALTWNNPAPIVYGEALTSNQLNATANVAGAFAYNPTNGTLLNSGNDTLSVIFTPSDTADYSSVTDIVSLVVAPANLTIAADFQTKSFAQTVTFAGTEFTAMGLISGDTVTNVSLGSLGAAAAAPIAGSPYPIIPSAALGLGLSNYKITYVAGELTVAAWQQTIQSANQSSNAFTFTWNTAPTQMYQVQSTTNLNQGVWTNLGSPIAATNSIATVSDPVTNLQMFYRVVLVP